MKFSLGDIVKLRHTGEEGRIVDFLKGNMVEVNVKGAVIPVFSEDLDHPYFDWFTKEQSKKQALRKIDITQVPVEQKKNEQKAARGFHLSFIPIFEDREGHEIVAGFKIYLLNETNSQIDLQYSLSNKWGKVFEHKGRIQAYSNIYLHNATLDELQEQGTIKYLLQDAKGEAMAIDELRLRSKKLAAMVAELLEGEKASLDLKLIDELAVPEMVKLDIPIRLGGGAFSAANKLKIPNREIIIDLHIENLVADKKKLNNYEMMRIQLNTFEDALANAIALGMPSMIVIHGVGKGRLKEEIHLALRSERMVRQFQSDWMPKYGFGATEVIFF